MESVYFRATKGYEPICQFYVDLLKKQLQENPIEPYGSTSVQIDNVKELVDVTAYKVTDFFATQVSPEISELYEYDKRPVENVTINPQRHAFDFCFSWRKKETAPADFVSNYKDVSKTRLTQEQLALYCSASASEKQDYIYASKKLDCNAVTV